MGIDIVANIYCENLPYSNIFIKFLNIEPVLIRTSNYAFSN